MQELKPKNSICEEETDIKVDIENQDQRKKDAITKLDDTSYNTPKMDGISKALEDKEPGIPSVDSADQKM